MPSLSERQQELCGDGFAGDYRGLKAAFINCTLKKPPEVSHTAALMQVAEHIMRRHGVEVTHLRVVEHDVPPGIYPDMREHGYVSDEWPELWERVVRPADILVIGTPIWLGQLSAVCKTIIERLYAQSADMNDKGQYVFYGKVGGCIVTGNEDGIKHVGMEVLYSLQHIGYTIPPQADAGWIGPAGPGPSYLDEGSGGPQNDFTQRNTTFMAWNLMHLAAMLKNSGGMPAWGNLPEKWNAGCKFGHPDPDYAGVREKSRES
ncbi:MAG TPA: flavodoxin family protein [Gammaproteobacteria bacterium]|nr:flavodoxin family protein [Gammaproteobacteria bacterium]